MSKSDENTNELESYGVWVKNSVDSDQPTPPTEDKAESVETVPNNTDLDLPDFDDTDFSDMFKDDDQFATDQQENDAFGNDFDTTLSTDELANITDIGDVAIESVDAPEETLEDFDDLPDMDQPLNSEPVESVIEEPIFDQEEELAAENIPEDLDIEEIENDVTTESESEEISLDDFMDEGFSDESVASGNNGYEPGQEENLETSNETEELSLDDFLDGETFENDIKDNELQDNEDDTIDMDISFDDSVEGIETEANISVEESPDDTLLDDDFDDMSENISMDDFISETDENDKENEEITDTESVFINEPNSTEDVNLDTEEIDLSDFGIDTEAEETPIVQDVENQKKKEEVVDYDLFIGDESTSSAPVVNEIKSNDVEKSEDSEPIQEKSQSTSVDNSLLQQIVADLSSLKDEINTLKTNIAEIKCREEEIAKNKEDVVSEQTVEIPEEEDQGGFFNMDDTDETIALSGDELDNIMNNAAFSSTEETTDQLENDDSLSQNLETSDEQTEPNVISEEIFDNSESETAITENDLDEVLPDSTESIDEIFDNNSSEETENTDTIENTILDKENNEDLDFKFEDENLQEPSLDDLDKISEDLTMEGQEQSIEDIPDEISIPKADDILVESTSTDFMDSVKDTTEDSISQMETLDDVEEIQDFEPIEDLEDNSEEIIEEVEEPEEIQEIDEIPSVQAIETAAQSGEPVEEDIEVTEVPTVDQLLNEKDSIEEAESSIEDNNVLPEESSLSDDDVSFLNVDDINNEEIDDNTELDIPEALEDSEVVEDANTEETVIKESNDEISVSEEEPVTIEETSIPEEEIISEMPENDNFEDSNTEVEPFNEVDNLDNNLSSSNLDYLTKKDDIASNDIQKNDLQQEIKSVLLYMDQLLENLPEDKIYEFAKSDEFATYKKLFKDLGLS